MSDTLTFEALRRSPAGELIVVGDSRYDDCRKVFNAMHDKRPAMIARCARRRTWWLRSPTSAERTAYGASRP
jgi:hypothetical protein